MSEIEDRLRRHERAFEGLLALTPAKLWETGDQDDQWQRKKASKEQKKQAKRAKLDPSSHKSAKDLMDENEKKRKRENGDSPKESIAAAVENNENTDNASPKRQKTLNGNGVTKAKAPQPKRAPLGENTALAPKSKKQQAKADNIARARQTNGVTDSVAIPAVSSTFASAIASDVVEPQHQDQTEPIADAIAVNGDPDVKENGAGNQELHKILVLPEVDKEALRVRLHARIEALRAARKADGIDGKPARTRQELIEARREKEAQKKTLKKEKRKQALTEQQQQANEAELARLRGSGSPVAELFSPPSPEAPPTFSFGRVTFDDGAQLDSSMESFLNPRKRSRMDPKAALHAAEKKKERLSTMDEEKQAEYAEKDLWLNAKKRAHGEKIRDDIGLLKKTVKRQEKAKQKSTKEWDARVESVVVGKEKKQKKREDNLRKRREDKGVKRGGKKGGSNKKVSRPGFEGSFKSRK